VASFEPFIIEQDDVMYYSVENKTINIFNIKPCIQQHRVQNKIINLCKRVYLTTVIVWTRKLGRIKCYDPEKLRSLQKINTNKPTIRETPASLPYTISSTGSINLRVDKPIHPHLHN
jgi:hypothetical protein